MRTIKQPENSGTCVAACVAMILDKTLEQVLDLVTLNTCPDTGVEYCPLSEELRVLAMFNYASGYSATLNQRMDSDEIDRIEMTIDLTKLDALVTVADEGYISGVHAVVWDSKQQVIRDPSPKVPDEMLLKEYLVSEWRPVQRIEEPVSLTELREAVLQTCEGG